MELPKKIIRSFHPLGISGFDPKADAGGYHGVHPLCPRTRVPAGTASEAGRKTMRRHRGEWFHSPWDRVGSAGTVAPPALLQTCCLVSRTSCGHIHPSPQRQSNALGLKSLGYRS